MTPAERLRAAATRLREAPASPLALALALADWLDDLSAGWPWDDDGTCVWDDGTPMRLEESLDARALAVADAVLNPTEGETDDR